MTRVWLERAAARSGVRPGLRAALPLALAVALPAALTAVLVAVNSSNTRDYVFLYLCIVAVLGLAIGVGPALLAAGASFLLVDFYFVRPVHTLQFADATDLINLVVFIGAAGIVGTVGSRRRAAQLRAERLANELQLANVELARLAETERQVRELEETDRMRRELLANVSHDLRTPLAGILTGATAMMQLRSLPDSARREAEMVATEARRLNRLVSDLLDMTRIEGGIVELQPADVDVREALTAAADRLCSRSPSRAVEVQVGGEVPEVTADWHRLGQVLDNLLNNADAAAPEGTPILLTASPHGGDTVVVRVIDRGPGVPAELRGRVFERFVRGEGGEPGMGLGLAIVRGLVEAQGGTVWLEDAPGGGASFAFTLPVSQDPR
ncbi:MAG TPA: ATP-binding protein [Candidatus Dormibacteraeota bacterium]|nr:ATP-binding protein [Candidatus Dormibacteraeota bacterium]